ncbi:isocitrate dehydrogenase [NAD] regulatory subunit 1, mitochondrial-like [Olea europaea var. sylvestris]|uniref:isocitrate dehydrogenase [NAD] regulatory subunit 1, mitochondrial-like n=1 Tax=Olea europaea var. sylvestris TaxID=158386 RepID=UPI000C1CFE3C|nr:isocitrate dehydrogenase [NAD] regulatory subunit 1, mitochondrial-like [Olea europaea var. sylvestris]
MSHRSFSVLKRVITHHPNSSHLLSSQRSVTYMPRPGDGAPRPVTLIPGDGIGPLVTGAVEQVMEAMHAPVHFEKYEVHGNMKQVPQEVLDSIRKNKVCLKGGLRTPVGGGVSSLNVQLRKELDLYASLVNCFNLPGLPTRHENVDIVVIRENTEGEYSGLEHEVVPGVVESLKVITKFCSERIAKYAFEYAYINSRKKVTAVHKANIMKLADGLFLESCREVATKYPGIKFNEIIVDNCCMQLVSKPEQFDVMVTPNLYGNLVANTAAGIAGGTGVMPGGNVGADYAVFEQGASAGNVGNTNLVEQKRANPIALLLSSAMMLRHLQFPSFADRRATKFVGQLSSLAARELMFFFFTSPRAVKMARGIESLARRARAVHKSDFNEPSGQANEPPGPFDIPTFSGTSFFPRNLLYTRYHESD